MTRQEQIEEMCEAIASMICQIYNPQCDEYEPHTCSHCYANDTLIGDFAEMLYNAGYRKIMNGKELNSELDEEECDVVDDYTIGFATYLMQKNSEKTDKLNAEIKRLKSENKQLKTECTLLDDELRNARQKTINVLNELKAKTYVNNYCREVVEVEKIDELIKEQLKK